jgi:hypothetical protein
VQRHFQALKQRMVVFREQEQKRLTHLTVVSDKCLKRLQSQVTMVCALLSFRDLCSS